MADKLDLDQILAFAKDTARQVSWAEDSMS